MSGFRGSALFVAFLAVALLHSAPPRAAAQDQQVLMPDQSTAKAKNLVQAAIDALGGSAFINVHDVTCTGNIGQFDHSGQLSGFEHFIQYSEPPGKDRTENLPQRNVIDVFNGDAGWTLDRGGVSDEPATQLAQHQADVEKSLDNILRKRINDPNTEVSYDGQDIVDLKQVDWIKLVDSDDRTIRIAFDRATYLPIRKTVDYRDPKYNTSTSEVEIYSLYHPFDGIQTAEQITRQRNGMSVYQVFFDKCDYNQNLDASLFTKQSLEDKWAKTPNRQKYHDKKSKNAVDSSPTN
jgi:hypothetical protein